MFVSKKRMHTLSTSFSNIGVKKFSTISDIDEKCDYIEMKVYHAFI